MRGGDHPGDISLPHSLRSPPPLFVRSHKSLIWSQKSVRALAPNNVIVQGGSSLAREDVKGVATEQAKFLTGNLMRHVAVMSLTASAGLVAIFLVDFVDLFFISMLGDPALAAAVGFAGTLLFLNISINIGMMIAISALAARRIGQGDPEEARRIATSVLAYGIAVGAFVGLIFWIAAPNLLDLVGATGDAKSHAIGYMRIIAPFMPIASTGMMCSGILRAHGDARRAMNATLAAGIVNAILDPIFIFGFGLGLNGAAIASVCASIAMSITALMPVLRHYGGFTKLDPSAAGRDFPAIVAIAAPAMLTNIATPVGNIIVMRAMAPFGDLAVAGSAVIGRLSPLAFCVIFALSGAIGPIVGQNFGAQNYARVRGAIKRAHLFAALYIALVWVFLVMFHGVVASQFNLAGVGPSMLFWFAVAATPLFYFNGALFISNAAFNNLNRPLWSTYLNWAKNTLGVAPFVWLGAQWAGAVGVVMGQAIGGIIFGLIATWLTFRLIDGFEKGDADPESGSGTPLMRARPVEPASAPRA